MGTCGWSCQLRGPTCVGEARDLNPNTIRRRPEYGLVKQENDERRGNEERADYVPLLPVVRATSKPGMQLNLQILDVRSTLRGRLYRSPSTLVAFWGGYVVTSEVERNDCNLSRVFPGGNVLAESV